MFNTKYILNYLQSILQNSNVILNNIYTYKHFRNENLQNLPSAEIFINTINTEFVNFTNESETNIRKDRILQQIWRRNFTITMNIFCNLQQGSGNYNLHQIPSELYRRLTCQMIELGTDDTIDSVDLIELADNARPVWFSRVNEVYNNYNLGNRIIESFSLNISGYFHEYKTI